MKYTKHPAQSKQSTAATINTRAGRRQRDPFDYAHPSAKEKRKRIAFYTG
jgi:hypothetical protein